MMSPADLRHLKSLFADLGQEVILLPDYSDTLDGPSWDSYLAMPPGGTSLKKIRIMGASKATVELGQAGNEPSAGIYLETNYGVPNHRLSWPVGVRASDIFFKTLEKLCGRPLPQARLQARGRLLDSYADAHKHVFNIKTVLYGEEDLVVAMAAFVREFGLIPVCCATGENSTTMEQRLRALIPDYEALGMTTMVNADFVEMEDYCRPLAPELMIGNSKGYKTARALGIPLVRVGFPIHDRIGGQRVLHVGYEGAQQLFDRIVNTLIEKKQEGSAVGYTYM
jgi:nitrogenase molybdenum-iron protein NifN